MSSLADIDRVLADLDPATRAIVAPIVLVLRALVEGLQMELARKDARIEQLLRTVYGRKSEQVPDPKREARKRASAARTPDEREAARMASRGGQPVQEVGAARRREGHPHPRRGA